MNCKYKSHFNKKAFTLIELLIVIAIIGILFIVLISKVDFATDKAKVTGVQSDFRSFQVALEAVSKENAGFNTFGWDTGDNAGAAPAGYTYLNADKDKGDRIRNSYDEGDKNLNGIYDKAGENGATVDEVWTGRKVYTENWTGCYTLINPGNVSDMSAIFDLQTAINKNLDPKLHINIADDGVITMANGAKDPWSTQYHGQYITNASADVAAKWNTDASMAGSTGDNMDRGAILMYSNGANQKFGTKVKIVGGVVTATVSQIDANTPDNNKIGADDYVLAVVYSYTNGYGEVMSPTWGFSQNNTYLTGNGGKTGQDFNNQHDSLPIAKSTLNDYTWEDLQALARMGLSSDEYREDYNLVLGAKKDDTYVLVDYDSYGGFVFMYQSGLNMAMNDSRLIGGSYTSIGGYASLDIASTVDDLFDTLDQDLQSVIKEVTIKCNDGNNGRNSYTLMHEYTCKLFLPSLREVGGSGFYSSDYNYEEYNSFLDLEGEKFDYFISGEKTAATNIRVEVCGSSDWWVRSADASYHDRFWSFWRGGWQSKKYIKDSAAIVPVFVV